MIVSLTNWLGLAATPAFALMALLTSISGDDMLCVVSSPGLTTMLGGMTPMYLMMSVFHLTPWLKLLSPNAKRAREGRASVVVPNALV